MRLPIRYRLLVVMVLVLTIAVGSFLYLASKLFAEDKLNYVYDLNVALVQSLSEQTNANLTGFARDVAFWYNRGSFDDSLFEDNPELLRVRLFPAQAQTVEPKERWFNRALADELGLADEDLNLIGKSNPLPIPKLAALEGNDLFLQNSSLRAEDDGGKAGGVPILTLGMKLADGSLLAADFKPDRLLRIFKRSEIHETYLVDDAGQILVHPNPKVMLNSASKIDHQLVNDAVGSDGQLRVVAFEQDGVEYLGGYAPVNKAGLHVLTQIARSEALRAGRELIQRSVLFGIAILLGAFIVSIFFSRYLTAPISKLGKATQSIAKGNFNVEVDIATHDEIADLGKAFNAMTRAMKDTQAQLVQSEKLAAFGQLGAGITHEVKNPMTGIIGFAQLAQRKIDDKEKVEKLLKMIEKEGLRCRDLLVNFLKFARAGGEHQPVDVNALMEEAANLLRHQLNMGNVKLNLSLASDAPQIMGNPAELQQVLMNLALNAQQAMPDGGQVVFESEVKNGSTIIRVKDTGPGIPADIRDRIFEPFFTTKPAGQGTGLGLSVSFGIIQSHHGDFQVDSVMGEGTTFTIAIPNAKS